MMGGKGDCALSAISENIGELQVIDFKISRSLLSMRGRATELIALQGMPDIRSKDRWKRYDTTTDAGYSS